MSVGQDLGRCVFFEWYPVERAVQKWVKQYFGDHTDAYVEREDASLWIELNSLKATDAEKYNALVNEYYPDGQHDCAPFDAGYMQLPQYLSVQVMADALRPHAMQSVGQMLATKAGVFFMERYVLDPSV